MDVVDCRGKLGVVRHGCVCVVIALAGATGGSLRWVSCLWLSTTKGAEEACADDVFAAPGGKGCEASEEALLGTDVVTLLLVGTTAVTARGVVVVCSILAWEEAREGDAPGVRCSDKGIEPLRD